MSRLPMLTIEVPARFSRVHLLVRVLLLALLSGAGRAFGWPGALVYLGLPVAAAILLSERGGERFLVDDAPRMTRAVAWLLGLYAYLLLLTDRFPIGGPDGAVRFEVVPEGRPTPVTAALRVLYSIPVALFLWLLSVPAGLFWIVSAALVLAMGRYPRAISDFQCGVLRFHARFLAYHGSLVEAYPRFLFEGGPSERAAPPPTGAEPAPPAPTRIEPHPAGLGHA